jgi:hypothetical protein
MPGVTFKIGDGFPAEDPVARFITVLAMMSNDWLRSMQDMLALEDGHPDAPGRRVSLFRQQAALHYEAAEFIGDARRRFQAVDAFITGLSGDAQQECSQVEGGIDPKSAHYHGDWLADHRNVTFHYPEMHPDKAEQGAEEIKEGLQEAAEIESSIESQDDFGSVRFRYADEVAVQWLPSGPEQAAMIGSLRESVMALSRFAQRAAQAYMDSRPSGTFTQQS